MAFATGEAVWGSQADNAARKYGVDPQLFRRLIKQESGWNPNAGSPAGALGLTQVVPKWHPNANLSTPQGQLDYGAKHLGSLLKKYGNPRDALAVYNSGKPWSVSQSYGETRNYVTNILNGYGASGTVAPNAAPRAVGSPAPRPTGGPVKLDANLSGDLNRFAADTEQAVLRGDWQAVGGMDPSGLAKRIGKVVGAAESVVGAPAAPSNTQGAVDGINGISAVDAAKSQIGTPYSWGGGTPAGPGRGFGRGANTIGFDCSSLVQYAWAKRGVKLPRTTYEQIKVGTAVPNVAKAQPGDLMFPHKGHVQMYIGNGKVIEAPFTGGRVRIVPAKSQYLAIRRPR